MKVSFIVLTWNSVRHIGRCLSSLIDNIDDEFKPYEIIVIDNGSTDGTRKIVSDYCTRYPKILNPILLKKNQGTTISRNLGLKKTTADFIAVVDSDIVAPTGFMKNLAIHLRESSSVGMVVPRLVYANGKFQKSTDDFPTIITKLKRYFFLKRMEDFEGTNNSKRAFPVDYAISAFWLMKRNVYLEVGNLDENIFYAPEDVDYCLRIWKAGYKIIYEPSCTIIHCAQEISRGLKLNKAFIEHIKGLFYYFCKHKYLFKKPYFPVSGRAG